MGEPEGVNIQAISEINALFTSTIMLSVLLIAFILKGESKDSKKSSLIVLLTLIVIAFAFYRIGYVVGESTVPKYVLHKYSGIAPYSYIIFGEDTDGDGVLDIIYAKNGLTGEIEYSGTDASIVIQKAINQSANLANGGKIFIRKGIYELSDTIKLKSNIIIQGEGIEATRLKIKTGVYKNVIEAWGSADNYIKNIVVMDLTVDGNWANNPTQGSPGYPDELYQNGIKLEYVENALIFNVKAYDCPWNGIQARNSKYVIYQNCIAEKWYWWGLQFWERVYYSIMEGCIAKDGEEGGIAIENAYFSDVIGNIVNNTKKGINVVISSSDIGIIGNAIETSDYGIRLENSDRVTVKGNVVKSDYPIYIASSTKTIEDIVVLGNILYSQRYPCIGINGGSASYIIKNIVIVGNILLGVGGTYNRGIYLISYVEDVIGIGNIIRNMPTAIDIHDSTVVNSVFKSNFFKDITSTIVIDSGTNTRISGNIGYATENSGTVEFATTSSVTFEHGLAGTPKLVLVSFNNTDYGAWTWTANSTHITITVKTANYNGTCYWVAYVYPP